MAGSRIAALAMALAAGLYLPAGLAGQNYDNLLRGEFFVDLMAPPSAEGFSSVVQPGFIPQYPNEEQAAALLKDAAWQFSAMIWGWDFVYTPSDTARKVMEVFDLNPRGEIQSGDPGLKVESTRLDGSLVYATLRYVPAQAARSQLAAWSSAVYAVAQGRASLNAFPASAGTAPQDRMQLRHAAIQTAVKEALRDYLRGQTLNKPREVRGSCVLAVLPRLVLSSGQYTASVRLRVRVEQIIPYSLY